MASIKQRKSCFSVIYWYQDEDGNRKQKWDTLRSKKEADDRKAFVEYYQKKNGCVLVPNEPASGAATTQAARTRPEGGGSITLRDFLKVFVEIYGTSKWSPSTYSSKVASIENYINPYIGDRRLCELTTVGLSAYYKQLLTVQEVPRSNRKPSGRCVQPVGVKKIHDIIRCALNQAIRWEYLDPSKRNPATLAVLPKVPKVRRKVWGIQTFRDAVGRVEDDLLALCMHLAFSCSLRIGEITGLTWKDVIVDEAAIAGGDARVIVDKELARVNAEALQKLNGKDVYFTFPTQKPHCTTRLVLKAPKSESSKRTVWLPRTLALMLARHKAEQAELREFLGDAYHDYGLVIALENGNPVESRIVRKRFQQLCEENGYEPVVFHSLRHLSTGYKLKMTGGDVKSVQGDTGHAEAEMVTDVYSEIVDEDRRHNAQRMDKEFYGTLERPGHATAPGEGEELLRAILALPPEARERLLRQLRDGNG